MGTSASFALARKITACFIAALLSLALMPASALAEDGHPGAEGSEGAFGSEVPTSPQPPSDPSTEASGSSVILSEGSEAAEVEGSNEKPLTLASGLVGAPSNFINSDVTLNGEPIVGSFTVDGLTYAVIDESHVELVGVSPNWQQVMSSQEGEDVSVAPMLASGSDGDESETATPSVTLSEAAEGGVVEGSNSNQASEAGLANLALPETITYEGVSYTLASIAPYAFYLSGVTDVTLPASVSDVDDRAFRSSDVANVTVAEGNPTYTSFDGALYDAEQLSLLLIPEGKQGTVLLPKEAEVAEAGKFSHCSLVDAISVEDGAAFSSENGLLYTADLTTLLRVPAGAEEVTIRDGCTTIAAGALEACAKLTTINAPATVTSISPDVFHAIPTVSLPAASLTESAPQLTAMVALSSADNDLPEVDPPSIEVVLPTGADNSPWKAAKLSHFLHESEAVESAAMEPAASSTDALSYRAGAGNLSFAFNTQVRYWTVSGDAVDRLMTPDYYAWLSMRVWFDTAGTLCCSNNVSTAKFGWFKSTDYSNFPWVKLNNITYRPVPGTTVFVHDGSATSKMVIYLPRDIVVQWNANGGSWESHDSDALNSTIRIDDPDYPVTMTGPDGATPQRRGYRFIGWATAQNSDDVTKEVSVDYKTPDTTFYAQWERADHDLGFNVDSEPNDEDYKGEPKDDQTITGDRIEAGETVEIENPKRPGYVFQGWTIPSVEGTEAIDQDLVYQGDDGKWYVDASQLPDYAGEDGRVELTARWTSVISVDVPSSATFYYDLTTDQSAEAHEAALSGTTSFSSKSQVDLRICGLESKKAAGADSLFSSGADSALLSVYPAPDDKAQTVEGAQQGPAGTKPATAVDFSLDDIVLERAFTREDADAYKITAGDDLTLAYRLNLSDAAKLDYDKILAMAEGDEASLASLTYCFAADYNSPADWGEPLWIENPDTSAGAPRFLVLDDIKAAAEDLSKNGEASQYFKTYDALMRAVTSEMVTNPSYDSNSKSFFQMKVGDSYVPVQIIGICDDVKTDGKKAGLTFQLKNACRATGQFYPNTNSTAYGWCDGSHPNLVREWLRNDFWELLPIAMQRTITAVVKHQQVYEEGGANTLPATAKGLQGPTVDTLFLPSNYEVFGDTFLKSGNGGTTVYFDRYGSEALKSKPGYTPMRYDWYATKQRTGDLHFENISRTYRGELRSWWTRSAHRTGTAKNAFLSVYFGEATLNYGSSNAGYGVVPCFAL